MTANILTCKLSHAFVHAQALRWSTQPQPQGSRSDTASSRDQQKQRVASVSLPNASYETAAIAVLAGLYQVAPWPKLLADLTPQQQVQAAVLADMWHLPATAEVAAGILQTAAYSTDEASAMLDELLVLTAVPDCLLRVFERALLTRYGDLEAVWDATGAALQESLLALPLQAMELLLASDEVEVSMFLCCGVDGLCRGADAMAGCLQDRPPVQASFLCVPGPA